MSFLSGGFITAIVAISLERKLEKHTSVQCEGSRPEIISHHNISSIVCKKLSKQRSYYIPIFEGFLSLPIILDNFECPCNCLGLHWE